MINLTVTDTLGWGFLTVFSAGIAATPNVSSINWFEDGMTVANHVVSAVDLAQLGGRVRRGWIDPLHRRRDRRVRLNGPIGGVRSRPACRPRTPGPAGG